MRLIVSPEEREIKRENRTRRNRGVSWLRYRAGRDGQSRAGVSPANESLAVDPRQHGVIPWLRRLRMAGETPALLYIGGSHEGAVTRNPLRSQDAPKE